MYLRSGCRSIERSPGFWVEIVRASSALSIPLAFRAASLVPDDEEEGVSRLSREDSESVPFEVLTVFLLAVLAPGLAADLRLASSSLRSASFSAFLAASVAFLASACSLVKVGCQRGMFTWG